MYIVETILEIFSVGDKSGQWRLHCPEWRLHYQLPRCLLKPSNENGLASGTRPIYWQTAKYDRAFFSKSTDNFHEQRKFSGDYFPDCRYVKHCWFQKSWYQALDLVNPSLKRVQSEGFTKWIFKSWRFYFKWNFHWAWKWRLHWSEFKVKASLNDYLNREEFTSSEAFTGLTSLVYCTGQ